MNKLYTVLLLSTFGLPLYSQSVSQELISSGSLNIESDNYSVSVAIGESVIETFNTTGYDITSGFLQSEILKEQAASVPNDIAEEVIIESYPNPVIDFLNVKINNRDLESFNVSVYNSVGSLMMKSTYETSKFKVDLRKFHRGIYFILINDSDNNVLAKQKIIIE